MSLRRFRRQYEQLPQFERRRIIGLMEAGWPARRTNRRLDRSDCVVRRFGDQWIRGMSFTRRPGSKFRRQKGHREVLHIEPFFNKIMLGLPQQRCHKTVSTSLPWNVRSPDLSPIEHIWDPLGQRVGYPTSLNKLEARLQQICNEMSQDIIQSLYANGVLNLPFFGLFL
ncbi:transposable element Tcb2 transposase [Trichonephila clavipes]|nr:transposable element Tcb2 transposase [Trichonephila clavipes]